MRGTFRGRVRRAVAVLLMAAAAVVAAAPPASAHAQLEGSDPLPGEVRATQPHQVSLTFGEGVEPAANAIRVLDDRLSPVATGPVSTVGAEGNRLAVSLPDGLRNGTYTVSWQVSSTDTHPVSGSFRFSIGAASVVAAGSTGNQNNDLAGLLLGVSRGVGFVGLALGPGLLLVVLALWRDGLTDARVRRLLWSGLGLLVLSTLGGMLLQGVWADGQPLSAIWSAPGSLDTHSRRFDLLYAARFYLVVAFGITLMAAVARRAGPVPDEPPRRRGPAMPADPGTPLLSPAWVLGLAAAVSAGLMVTWAMAGHAATGTVAPLAVAANVVHLVAMSTWLGGLALVAIALRPAARVGDLAAVLPRFSRLAFTCVLVIVATGTFLAWREVRSLDALRSTEYGRLLLVKLAGVVALVALGNLARTWVQRHLVTTTRRPPLVPPLAGVVPVREMTFRPLEAGPGQLRRLHAGLVAEIGIAVAVLGLTSALVVIVPAQQEYVAPFHKTVTTNGTIVDLDLAEPRVGDTVLHVIVRGADGRPMAVTAMRGSMTLPAGGLGRLDLQPVLSGGVSAAGASATGEEDLKVSLPARGTWTLRLTVQTSPVEATALSADIIVS